MGENKMQRGNINNLTLCGQNVNFMQMVHVIEKFIHADSMFDLVTAKMSVDYFLLFLLLTKKLKLDDYWRRWTKVGFVVFDKIWTENLVRVIE